MSADLDERSIREIVAEQELAWNNGDADAFAVRFHSDGSFTNVFGDRYFGRDAFRERHAAIFGTFAKGSKASMVVSRIRFPVAGTAIVDVDCGLTGQRAVPPGLHAAPDGALRTSLLQVLVKDAGGWWVAAYHNVDTKPLPTGPRP